MRDREFVSAMNKMAPILAKKFHFLAKAASVKDDRKSFVEDLISLTTLEALLNSRKEKFLGFTCEQLIRIKAKNVWAEYQKQRAKTFNHANHNSLELLWNEEQLPPEGTVSDDRTLRLLQAADSRSVDFIQKRLAGFQVEEIGAMYNTSAGSITMQIQRLKKKIQERP